MKTKTSYCNEFTCNELSANDMGMRSNMHKQQKCMYSYQLHT